MLRAIFVYLRQVKCFPFAIQTDKQFSVEVLQRPIVSFAVAGTGLISYLKNGGQNVVAI